jgi:nucleotide-binding universal stress UspA family protein
MYQRILVPIDGSPTSNAGLAEAVRLAKMSGAQLRLLHVVDELGFVLAAEGSGSVAADMLTMSRDAGKQILEQGKRAVEQAGLGADTVMFDGLSTRLCECVAEQARQWPADLVVIGTHGRRGVKRLLLGSDAEQILRTSVVPVLSVRAGETQPTRLGAASAAGTA